MITKRETIATTVLTMRLFVTCFNRVKQLLFFIIIFQRKRDERRKGGKNNSRKYRLAEERPSVPLTIDHDEASVGRPGLFDGKSQIASTRLRRFVTTVAT